MLILRLLPAAAALLLGACATVDQYLPTTGDFRSTRGTARVKIDLSEQRAYLYKSGDLVTSTRVSTGKRGHRTPTGTFKVTQKSRDHRSSLYGDYVKNGRVVKAGVDVRKDKKPKGAHYRGASMPYFIRFNGAVGMHAGNVPDSPASHGCVRLPPRMARTFFKHVPVGSQVRVVP